MYIETTHYSVHDNKYEECAGGGLKSIYWKGFSDILNNNNLNTYIAL